MKISLVLILSVIIITVSLFSVVFLGFKYNESSKQIEDLESKFMDYEFEINALKYNLDQTKKMIGTDLSGTEVVYSTYKNDELGFSFDYPSEWGEVNVETIDVLGFGINEREKSLTLSFTQSPKDDNGKDLVEGKGNSVSLADTIGAIEGDFGGILNNDAGVDSSIDAGFPGCSLPNGDSLGTKYEGRIYFNLPTKEIKGFMLVVPVLSDTDVQKIDEKFGNTKIEIKKCNEDELASSIEITQMIESSIFSEQGLDEESKRNLGIFNKIVESAKVF